MSGRGRTNSRRPKAGASGGGRMSTANDGEEKKDPSKSTPTKAPEGASTSALGSSESSGLGKPPEFANPLYCSSVDGKYVYKDPTTGNQFEWDEGVKQWKPKGVGGGSAVEFDGSSYTYTDASDGTKYEWDADKSAWFPKSEVEEADNGENTRTGKVKAATGTGTATASTTASATATVTPSSGYHNPNYDSNLQGSGAAPPRRFYYAALSPSEMGVNEPVLFLSPDDQVNNNSTIPQPEPPPQPGANSSNSNNTTATATTTASTIITSGGLPPGWERHEDANGPYYWHIKSGTIQRELPTSEPVPTSPPIPALSNPGALLIPGGGLSKGGSGSAGGIGAFRRSQTISSQLSTSLSFSSDSPASSNANVNANGGPNSSTSTVIGAGQGPVLRRADTHNNADNKEKRKSWSQYLESNERETRMRESLLLERDRSSRPKSDTSLRFVAVSLGCLSISEEDLTPERSSRAVSKVIAELTSVGMGIGGGGLGGAKGAMEVAGKIWAGEGSELYLELDDAHLRVKTKGTSTGASLTVAEQPIHSIRVWGVGRDDPRDFAYVAREKLTRQFLCHVFRLEMNARPLASALRDACKKIMIERQQKQKRPTTLPTGLRKGAGSGSGGIGMGPPTNTGTATAPACFPTPMDEPRKILKAFYLGSKMVTKPTGMDTLNGAIDVLRNNEPVPVSVSVAPSVLHVVSDAEGTTPPRVSIEIRVRYLSFMGIGRDVQTCGVIVHTARDDFQAHCFLSTPSSGALCKAIEAACVLRYQKCLDAHHGHDQQHAHQHGSSCPGSGNNSQEASAGGSTGSGGGGGSSSSNTSTTPGAKAAANIAAAFKNAKSVLSSLGRAKSVEDKV